MSWSESTITRDEFIRELDTVRALTSLEDLTEHLDSYMRQLFLASSIELDADELQAKEDKAREWAHRLYEDAPTGDIVQELLAFVDSIRDTRFKDEDGFFFSTAKSVSDKLPSAEDVGMAYVYLVGAPFYFMGYSIRYGVSYAWHLVWNSLMTEEQRTMAKAGLGLTAAGLAYTVLKED